MHARTGRLALAASGLAVIGLVGGASATKPVISGPKTLVVVDPAGDEKGSQGSMDITSLKLTTTGKTVTQKVKGKSVTTYTPNTLVVQLALSLAPSTLPIVNFEVDGDTSDCGSLSLYYDGQNLASGGFVGCGSPADATGSTSTSLREAPVAAGNTITWTLPFSSLPKQMKVGSSISSLHGYGNIADPVSGLSPSFFTNAANPDDVTSDAAYKIG